MKNLSDCDGFPLMWIYIQTPTYFYMNCQHCNRELLAFHPQDKLAGDMFFSLYSQHNLYVVILAPTETIVDHELHGSWIAKSLICKGSVMVYLCWFVIHLHFLEGKRLESDQI